MLGVHVAANWRLKLQSCKVPKNRELFHSSETPMPDTIGYYQEHAEDFVESTFDVAMDVLYCELLPLIPKGGHILDAGCGSGRDAYHFHRKGFTVSAFDGALAIVELARKKTGLAVECRQFSEITEEAVYDGVWACASLLHLPADQVPDTIERLWRVLRACLRSFE